MLQPGVDDFFDAAELGAPGFLGVIESSIHVGPQIAQAGVVDQDSHEYGQRRNANGKRNLNTLIHRGSISGYATRYPDGLAA
jgi:hypothetical protein